MSKLEELICGAIRGLRRVKANFFPQANRGSLSIAEIPNNRLRISDIPVSSSEWGVIQRFALTFNGYSAHGSVEACGAIANERRGETLTDLRTCLFFEQRRWRHFGYSPESDDLSYIRGIVDRIREKVQTGLVD